MHLPIRTQPPLLTTTTTTTTNWTLLTVTTARGVPWGTLRQDHPWKRVGEAAIRHLLGAGPAPACCCTGDHDSVGTVFLQGCRGAPSLRRPPNRLITT